MLSYVYLQQTNRGTVHVGLLLETFEFTSADFYRKIKLLWKLK